VSAGRRGRTMLSRARGANQTTHHGPLQRLLDGAAGVLTLAVPVVVGTGVIVQLRFNGPNSLAGYQKEYSDFVNGQRRWVALRALHESVNVRRAHCGAKFLRALPIPTAFVLAHALIKR